MTKTNRFVSLFKGFLDYSIEYYTRTGLIDVTNAWSMMDSQRTIFETFGRLWGPTRDQAMLESYLAENPDGLRESDLSVVRSWRYGLFGTFEVTRLGDDVYLTDDDRAYMIWGLKQEFDEMGGTPGYPVETAVLPYEGHLTYALILISHPKRMDEAAVRERCERLIQTGHAIYDEEGLMRYVSDTFGVPDVPEPLAPNPSTPLAGLDWEEREQYFKAHLREESDARLLELYEKYRLRGKVQDTFKGCLMGLTRPQLEDMVRPLWRDEPVSKMNKDKLVDTVIEHTTLTRERILDDISWRMACDLRVLRACAEGDGRYEFSLSDVDSLISAPTTIEPYLWLYRQSKRYLLVMPKEVIALLEGVDWDTLLRRAEAIDDWVAWLITTCDFRGIVSLDEAMQWIAERSDGDDIVLLKKHLDRRIDELDLPIIEMAPPYTTSHYLLTPMLAIPLAHLSADTSPTSTDVWSDILSWGKRCAARRAEDVGLGIEVNEWVRGLYSFRKLAVFLDGVVPPDEDPFVFVDEMTSAIVRLGQALRGYAKKSEVRLALGTELSGTDLDAATAYALDLLQDVPRWAYNGWAPSEKPDLAASATRPAGSAARPRPKPKAKTKRQANKKRRGTKRR